MSCKCNAKLINFNKATVKSGAKIITHDNKQVMVVPVVAIVEGVLNGKLVTTNEFAAVVEAWEGVPIPVKHPTINGENVSANLPSIIESIVIGYFHNVKLVGNALHGDMYIDIDSAKRKGFEGLLDRLAANEQIEVSTAYFAEDREAEGIFDGANYTMTAHNLRPDHLAILPDDVGACSIERGCGTFSRLMANAKRVIKNLLTGNDESFDQIRDAVSMELRKDLTQDQPSPWICDLYPDAVVYEIGGELLKRGYTMSDGVITLAEPNAVRVEKQYVPIEVNDMSDKPTTAAPVVATVNAEDAAVVTWAKELRATETGKLVSKITGNASNKLTSVQLAALPFETLQAIADSIPTPIADFSGRGVQTPAITGNAGVEIEVMPATSFITNAEDK